MTVLVRVLTYDDCLVRVKGKMVLVRVDGKMVLITVDLSGW